MRCKVKLVKIIKMENGHELEYRPVTSGDFFKFTPYGEIKLGIVNDAVVAGLEPGKEYYIDFTEAM
jgi:hypothetical protein